MVHPRVNDGNAWDTLQKPKIHGHAQWIYCDIVMKNDFVDHRSAWCHIPQADAFITSTIVPAGQLSQRPFLFQPLQRYNGLLIGSATRILP